MQDKKQAIKEIAIANKTLKKSIFLFQKVVKCFGKKYFTNF